MARICEVCGKKPSRGGRVKRRGMAKKKGGVGRRITGRSKRTFYPNLKTMKIEENGESRRIVICNKCKKKSLLSG